MHRASSSRRRHRAASLFNPLESLEARAYYSVHAFFVAAAGRLTVFGDAAGNEIVLGRDAGGAVVVNGGAVGVRGGEPAGDAVRQILVYGLSGDDVVRLDEANGPLPRATLNGGPGNDVLTGGSGADILVGQAGSDFLFGQGGADILAGGAGDDALTGGADNDLSSGQSGDDALFWNPGDGSDRDDGGDGVDTVGVNGATGPERFAAAPNGARVRFDRTDPNPFSLDIGTVETLSLRANAGDDTFAGADGLAQLIHLTVDGGVGNDTLLGSDGADDLLGRDGNDFVDGNGGNDLALLGDGDDTFRWDPGDGSDVVEGQNGIDSMVFNGSDLPERIDLSPNGPRVRLKRDVGNVLMDLNGLEQVRVNALGGADEVVASLLAAGIVDVTEDGGAGNDTLVGTRGNDTLLGGDGDDDLLGFRGNDTALMGAGDDTFEWLPGDGSDTVDGQAGRDTLLFNGSNDAEKFDLSADGNRARFTRDLGGVAMDLDGVERLDLNAFGGADTVTINDQSATDLTALDLALDGAAGTGFGDGAADSVVVNATALDDGIQIASFGTRIAIGGLFPFMNITGEDGLDALTVNTLGGDDVVDSANLAATNASELVKLTLIGGAGNDTLVGSQGADTFVWNPGDGSDVIEGQENPDTVIFNGSDVSENLVLSADGDRVRITDDVGGVTMSLGGVENATVSPLGGADAVTVEDLTGTAVTRIDLILASTPGGCVGDGRADSVVVNGTAGGDFIPVLGNNGAVLVNGGFLTRTGLPYFMVIRNPEATDLLQINGNGGDDTIDASELLTPVRFRAEGRAGNDTLIGSPGDDVLIGGPGDDALDGRAGNNVLVQD
jgi:Ca2+-binding RTX toxin-like protein